MGKNGKSQFAILGMLGLLKACSGYDLKKKMESSTQYFWKETFSSIYPVLEDLENQKLIKKLENPHKNERKRNVYALTDEGHKALENWLRQAPEEVQLRSELLLKLFFGNMTPVAVSIQHLENHKKQLENKLSIYQEFQKELSALDSLESLYWLITLDHGISQVSSSLQWCERAIKALQTAEHQMITETKSQLSHRQVDDA